MSRLGRFRLDEQRPIFAYTVCVGTLVENAGVNNNADCPTMRAIKAEGAEPFLRSIHIKGDTGIFSHKPGALIGVIPDLAAKLVNRQRNNLVDIRFLRVVAENVVLPVDERKHLENES